MSVVSEETLVDVTEVLTVAELVILLVIASEVVIVSRLVVLNNPEVIVVGDELVDVM